MTSERKQRILCLITDDQGEYYYNGPLDGIWGPESQNAADRFLRDFTGETAEEKTATGTWWDEIEYFDPEEPGIACPCGRCGGFPVEPVERLMRNADATRKRFGKPMTPSSTIRCAAHNAELPGSAANSLHMRGKAMDFAIPGISSDKLLDFIKTLPDVHEAYAIDGSYVHMGVEKY